MANQRSGATLLLALLILGGFVTTAVSLSGIVLAQLRNVRAIDQSTVALYAAESGIEDILYRVRKEEQYEGLDGEGTLENNSAWTRDVAEEVGERTMFLNQDIAEQVDIFPISGDFGESVEVKSLLIDALDRRIGGLPGSEHAWLEVTWVPWLQTGEWADSIGRALRGPTDLENPVVVDLWQHPSGETPFAYRVRLRALEADLGYVRIRASSDQIGSEENLVSFPSSIKAISIGRYGGSRYALQVEFPARLPLAPAFDYVLFSACDIVKGGSGAACP
ncbi:MAG: hypothetical protein ABIG71_01730 [Candidatus Uhrbacteria bacterium]